LGHGTGINEAISVSLDGKVLPSLEGKTGQGHYAFDAGAVYDERGRFDLFATLRNVWKRAATGGYLRDLAEFHVNIVGV
jgi:hypothetical protein